MDPRNDIQSLYDKAAEHLHTTRDAKLETLKLQIASARVYDIIITPESVSELLDKPVKEGNADFIALRAGGFIETHYTHLAWTRFDPVNRARSLAALAAFEANVALRARHVDMTPIMPRLEMLVASLTRHADNGEHLEMCVTAQRLFVALVASIAAPEMVREYTAMAKAGLAYAWSIGTDGKTVEMREALVRLVEALGKRDGVSAARSATYLRSMPDKIVLKVPLSF